MRRDPSSFYPFENPLYKDWLFYLFVLYSLKGIKENITSFLQYETSDQFISLIFDFAGSIFISWIMALAIFAVKTWIKNRKSNIYPIKHKDNYKLTKLEKPIGEMTETERKNVAEELSKVMFKQINEYKNKDIKD